MRRERQPVVTADNLLAEFHPMGTDTPAARLAENVRALRDARGLTQAQAAKLAELPRATWANVESGESNPTLAVMHAVSVALQVSFEELLAAPRAGERLHPRDTLPVQHRGQSVIRKLLPDRIPGTEFDRFELPPGARMTGVPHTAGTREYLVCESGALTVTAAGRTWTLAPGDVLAFRGDQRHSYGNPGHTTAVGYSVVLLEPVV